MTNLEQWAMDRLKTIALMAAILEAGERAAGLNGVERAAGLNGVSRSPDVWVERAELLFDAADEYEGERAENLDAEAEAMDADHLRGGPIHESPSYRDAMVESGRGGLLP